LNRLANLMPGLFGKHSDDHSDVEEESWADKQRSAPKHGPYGPGGSRVVKFATAGQQRRAQERWTRAAARKANRRYRKQWVANEEAFQRLLSQVGLLQRRPESALAPGVERVLIERYGSVDDARAYLASLIEEREANAAARRRQSSSEYKASVTA
jgi:hypothetical protein